MSEPKICLGMMVCDEEPVIERALISALPFIDTWSIVDTGSVDKTKDIVRATVDGIPGMLHEYEWSDDYGRERTRVFDLAREHGDYVLMLDAADVLEAADDFSWGQLGANGYHVNIHKSGQAWPRLLLLKTDKQWVYIDPRHEQSICGSPGQLPFIDGMRIVRPGEDSHRRIVDPIKKYMRDCEIYEELLKKDPHSPRHRFYYAQSLRDAHEYGKAIEAYKVRVKMGGYWEEAWYSQYQVGVLFGRLGQVDNAIAAYLEAYEQCPKRAEPLYMAGWLAREQKRFGLAYLLSSAAVTIRRPQAAFFVEDIVYRWRALDEFAISAYWTDHLTEALEANYELLRRVPEGPERARVKKNLIACQQKLAPVRQNVGKPSGLGDKKILITGAGRSGTGYLSKVLNLAGVRCGHENVFGPYTQRIEWGEYDADSSWLAVPWLHTLEPDVHVVHVIRDFLPCARSWAGVGQFDDNAPPYHAPYRMAVDHFAPGIMRIQDRLGRIAAYWAIWNQEASRAANRTIRIEDVDLEFFEALVEEAKIPVKSSALKKAIEQVPTDYNTRTKDENLTLDDFKQATPPHIWKRVVSLCNFYGYKL